MGISLCRIEIKCVGINFGEISFAGIDGVEISFADLWGGG